MKLLEVSEDSLPVGIRPVYFRPHPPSGVVYSTAIVEVTPEEFDRLGRDDGELQLPAGWRLGCPIEKARPRKEPGRDGTPRAMGARLCETGRKGFRDLREAQGTRRGSMIANICISSRWPARSSARRICAGPGPTRMTLRVKPCIHRRPAARSRAGNNSHDSGAESTGSFRTLSQIASSREIELLAPTVTDGGRRPIIVNIPGSMAVGFMFLPNTRSRISTSFMSPQAGSSETHSRRD